jgi:hypothetical protein
MADEISNLNRIDVATTGLTLEQLKAFEESFARIRRREIDGTKAPVVDVAFDPPTKVSWRNRGVKHHGVLMLAERGFNVRLPVALSAEPAKHAYKKILSQWIFESIEMIRKNPSRLPEATITVLDFGKIESIPAKQNPGIVIGAPHGTFDVYTARTVRQICSSRCCRGYRYGIHAD